MTGQKQDQLLSLRGCSAIVAQTAPRDDSKAGSGVVRHPEAGFMAEGSRGEALQNQIRDSPSGEEPGFKDFKIKQILRVVEQPSG